MNQKRQKKERAKLIAQAKILLESAKLLEEDLEKIAYFTNAALILKNHLCPERVESLKNAIELSEKLEDWEGMLSLAVIGLKIPNYQEDIDFYQGTIRKYHEKINSEKDEKT